MRKMTWLLLVAAGCAPSGSSGGGSAAAGGAVSAAPQVAVVKSGREPSPVPSSVVSLRGLEESEGWFPEEWPGSNPPDVAVVEEPSLGKCLAVESPGGAGDKSAVGLVVSGSYDPKTGLRVDFFNPGGRPLKAALGLFLSSSREYFESPVMVLPPGYSTHTLNLDMPVWKSRSTGWKYRAVPSPLDQVEQVDVVLYESGKVRVLAPFILPPGKNTSSGGGSAASSPGAGASGGGRGTASSLLSPEEEARLKAGLSPGQKRLIKETLSRLESGSAGETAR